MLGVSIPGAGAARGPVWNNAAPQQFVQQPRGGINQASFLAHRSSPSYSGYMPTAVGAAGSSAPSQQTNVFTGGKGGYTGNGMISQLDYASVMGDLMQQKYESGVRAFQSGDQNAPGWYQLQELKAQADRFKTTVANGGYTGQMFSRPQFEAGAAFTEFNEAAKQWGGQQADWMSMVPRSIAGTPWTPWQGFQATPIGTSFGGGINMEPGGGYERNISNTAPLNANRPSAFSGPYNNGDLRSASDFGSYNSPLLRSGANDHFAVASIRPHQNYDLSGGSGNEVSGQILPRGYSDLQPMTPLFDPRGAHSDWTEDEDGDSLRQPQRGSATQSGEIEIHQDSGGAYYQFPDGRKQYMAPQSFGGTVLPMDLIAPVNIQRRPASHSIQEVISPYSANNITQGQLDAYYGYYGQSSARERANIMNARPTYFDRE